MEKDTVMSKKRAEPLALATIVAAGVGTAQASMTQMGGGGMGGTNQYGVLEILGLVIGVAILFLLAFLVARSSKA